MSARYTTEQGLRHYIVDDERHYPSVTSILSATQTWKERKALENWGKRNPGGGEKAAARGSAIHSWCENYLLRRQVMVPRDPEVAQYLTSGLVVSLQRLSIQKPLWVEHSLCSPHTFVWHDEYGYAGCPDWVTKFAHPQYGPVMTMVDLKTSTGPYERHYPSRGATNYHQRMTGAKKYEKVCMQLMAYSKAMEKTLGLEPTMLMVVVAQPGKVNNYILTQAEKEKAWDEFRRRCDAFYARYSKSTRLFDFEAQAEEEKKENDVTVNVG